MCSCKVFFFNSVFIHMHSQPKKRSKQQEKQIKSLFLKIKYLKKNLSDEKKFDKT